jgi:diacylglycerol kinase (ATP)
MSPVAVIAHNRKMLHGGLPAFRRALDERGVLNPLWCEVSKSKCAPEQVRRALEEGANLIFIWGGDGMVQRCADVLAGSKAVLAIVPAGTANLLASNLGIPRHIESAVEIGLSGVHRRLDLGRVNGERFATMAGAGFDARVVRDADIDVKRRLGRMGYLFAVSKNVHAEPFDAEIEVDGTLWFQGHASCVLFGNVGRLFAGISVFDCAQPDDGMLDLGVATPDGWAEWTRTIARTTFGSPAKSPFVRVTKGRVIDAKLGRKVLYELDGGARKKTRALRVEIEPAAVNVCVPAPRAFA